MFDRSFVFGQHRFVVGRGVFDPVRHLSGVAFAEQLADLVAEIAPGGRTALDLGTGSGLLAATLARLGMNVVATDISEAAVASATMNCRGLDVDVRRGDMFDPVEGETFDLVIVNPPYERAEPTWRRGTAFTSPDFLGRLGARVHEFAPRLVIGFPIDDAQALRDTGLGLQHWRTVNTAGRELGLFVSVTQATN